MSQYRTNTHYMLQYVTGLLWPTMEFVCNIWKNFMYLLEHLCIPQGDECPIWEPLKW